MRRSFYTIAGLIGFMSGVLLYLIWQPSWSVLLGIGLISVLLGRIAMRPYIILVSIFVMAVCLGLLRSGLAEHRVTPDQIDFYHDQKIEFEGVVVEADVRRDKAKYTIQVDQITPAGGATPASRFQKVGGDVLISLNKYPQYHYGDRLRVYGELKAPGEFDGFDYGNYLSRYDIYSVVYYPRIELIGTGEGSLFWEAMTFAQNTFMERINRIFPEPYASFEAGLLVGARKGIPPALMEQFNITGLTHIIAISGYNITIIIVFVMALLKGLPRRMAFYCAVVSIILFTLFVGASPAVVRASIMGILGLIALNHGRENNIHLTVLFSAFFMVLWNPKILWWDVGFQLSFAAVLGLIYVAPLFDRYSQKLPQAFGVREAIQMTLSAQVMALPIIIYNFERLSLIAPLANLVVIFAIPPAMLFGFLSVLLSFLSSGLSLIAGYIAWGILSYIIRMIELMAAVPYASIDLPGMRLWMLFGYYGLLILGLIWWKKRRIALETINA